MQRLFLKDGLNHVTYVCSKGRTVVESYIHDRFNVMVSNIDSTIELILIELLLYHSFYLSQT